MPTPYAVPAPDDSPEQPKTAYAVPAPDDAPAPDGFRDSGYGFKVKDAVTHTGKPTVQREDGALWYGPEQGNKGAEGWFNAKGQRVGLKSGVGTMDQERFANPVDVLGQGATDLPVKAVQIGAHLAGSQAVDPYVTQREQDFQAQYGNGAGVRLLRTAGSVMGLQGMGKLAASGVEAALPAATEVVPTASRVKAALEAIRATKAGKVLVPVAQSTATGAVMAPLFTPDANVQSNDDFWAKQVEHAQTGAKFGFGIGLGATTLGLGIPAAVNAWANKFRNPKAAQLLADAEAANIPLKASEIRNASMPPPANVEAAEKAVTSFSDNLKTTMNETPFTVGELPKVAAGNGPRSAAAKAILEKATEGGDADKILSTSAGIRAVQEKIRMDQLGSARSALAEGVPVAPDKPVAVLDAWLRELTGPDASKWPQKESLIKKLQDVRENLLKTSKEVPTKILDEAGNAITKTVDRPNSFTSFTRTRSDVGDEITGYYKGANSEIGSKGANHLQAFKNSINEAMSDAAQNSGKPALAAADRTFNAEYSKYASTFKDPDVIKVINNPTPDTLLDVLAKAGPKKAQKIMDVLDPKGQAAYAVGTFNRAIEKAVNKRTGGDIIPGNVSGGMVDVGDALGVVIKDPALKSRMDSMLNVLQAMARSDPRHASALGQRVTGSIVEANDKLNAVSKLYQMVKDGGVDMFFNTKAGKEFLFKAKGLKPESPAMNALLRQEAPFLLAAQSSAPNVTPLRPTIPAAASTGTPDQIAQKPE